MTYYLRALLKPKDIKGIVTTIVYNLGITSLYKYGTDMGRVDRCSKDKVDLQSHWKLDKHQSRAGKYMDTTITYVDGRVAATFCPSGPIAYL